MDQTNVVTVAAGVNLGYSLTWTIGFLANRPDLQQNGFEAISAVYDGKPPLPHEFDRVSYVKALHTVPLPILNISAFELFLTMNLNRKVLVCSLQSALVSQERLCKVLHTEDIRFLRRR